MKKLTTFLSAIFLFILTSTAFAQITVNEDIDTDATWGLADSPVTVSETITVSENATLTIEPGVTVQMGNTNSIIVEGALVADGTENDEILFTSSTTTAGDWGSIEFRNNTDVGSVFDYVTVEYGAGADRSGMVFFTTGAFPVDISNATFRNSAEHGINLRASASEISDSEFYDNAGFGVFADLSLNFTVTESQIYRNTQGGIRVPLNSQATINESLIDTNGVGILIENNGRPEITNSQIRENNTGIRILQVGSSQPVISDNIIAGNEDWGIESLGGDVLNAKFNYWGSPLGPTVVSNPTGNGDNVTTNIDYTPWRDGTGMDLPVVVVDSNINVDTTWENGNVYLVTSNITVGASSTLTIEPGTIVKFESDRSMTVAGKLTANGNDSSLIVFTSDKDDSAGGDSNEDEDSSTPGAGNWGNISIESSGSEMSYAVIRYGSSNSNSGVLYLDAPISLDEIYINNNAGNGIYSETNQTGWTNVRSTSNNRYGFYFRESALQMTGGETSLNDNGGIYFYSSENNRAVQLTDFEALNNNGHGIQIIGNSSHNGTRIDELINSTIAGNNIGLYLEFSNSGSQLFEGNTIENNSSHGISLYHGLNTEDVIFDNNTITNNGQSGIRTNRARFIDNTFGGNRFGIGTWHNIGLSYLDDADQDGNTFSGNTYSAIALYANSLRDTLSSTVPDGLGQATYILASTGTANSNSDTFVIEPGVTIKTSPDLVNSNSSLRFDGRLIAEGTDQDPIVFTSLFDHDYGGNVAADGDNSTPSSGDWGGLHLYRNGTQNSILKDVYIRYGRVNLEMGTSSSNQVEYANTFENLWIDNASFDGLFIEESSVVFENLTLTNNGRHGIWLRDRSSNSFVTHAEIINSEISGNGSGNNSNAGLYAQSLDDGATYRIIQNSLIENNSNGIVIEDANAPTALDGNIIRDNDYHGVKLVSSLQKYDISYFGNTITGNGQTGILSSKAVFIDNTFEENRFPIGAWNRLGHIYVDETDSDGNSFTDNTYNNVIALYANNLQDTLSATVPQAFDNPSYILASTGSANSSSHTLLIEPGVTVKTSSDFVNSNTSLRFDGQLIAEGTDDDPIVFTSLYDHDYGGNIALEDDENDPSSGDWGGLHLFRTGTQNSSIKNVYIRYGRTNLEMGTSSSSQVVYANIFENLWVDNASFDGLFIEESFVEFDGLRATNNGRRGVWLRDRSSNGFVARAIIRNSEITNNGGSNDSNAGLFAGDRDDGATFPEITNTVIEDNSNGVIIQSSPIPSSFQFNEIRSNSHDGIYARMNSVSSDTALAVTGNTFSGHQNGTGIISSRAIIEDNTFENNEIPIAVMEEISRDGTANEDGNYYEGNTFSGHTYKDAIGIYATNSVSLDGNLGYTWPADYTNPVLIPITGTTPINAGDSVNVAPGTVIKLGKNGSNSSFRIRGTMYAEGSVDSKIIFTSLTDDTYAGDTNRDSTDTVPSRGNWDELLVDGTSSSETTFRHVIARYGSANFFFDNDTEALIDSSFISNATYGIYSEDGAKPTVRNSDIHTNRYGMRVVGDSDDPNIHLNNFYNNDDAAIHAYRDVTAINNYWGDSTGPFVDQGSDTDPNLDGEGNEILVNGSNRVEYEPFQVSRSGILLGDVSEGGSVSAFDASLILQYAVGDITFSSSQESAADVTGDGTISSFDASNILQYVVGAISGFPGAGKAPAIAAEDLFKLETELSDSHLDLVIQSQGILPIYAGQLDLEYEEERYSSAELISTAETAEWSSRINAEDGVAKAALAGVEPVETAGDMIHLRFHFEEKYEGTPGNLEITKLVLNEIDVTETANNVLTSNTDDLEVPQRYALEQNYPNPFNPATNIQYQLPENGEVTVTVFNSIGQKISTLVNQAQRKAGIYTVNWNAESAASGVYFYRIEVSAENGGNFMDVKKMTLIK